MALALPRPSEEPALATTFSQSTNHYGLRHVFGFQFSQLQVQYHRVIYFGFVRLMKSNFDQLTSYALKSYPLLVSKFQTS